MAEKVEWVCENGRFLGRSGFSALRFALSGRRVFVFPLQVSVSSGAEVFCFFRSGCFLVPRASPGFLARLTGVLARFTGLLFFWEAIFFCLLSCVCIYGGYVGPFPPAHPACSAWLESARTGCTLLLVSFEAEPFVGPCYYRTSVWQ